MRYYILTYTLLATLAAGGAAHAADWMFAPSKYTHNSQTGERVTQYSPIGPFYIYPHPNYVKSGYRHTRSTLRGQNSVDQMHIVEEWGRPVRPYGEWQYPYRPYSVPYNAWGPNYYVTPWPYYGSNNALLPGHGQAGYGYGGNPGHGSGHPSHGVAPPGHGGVGP